LRFVLDLTVHTTALAVGVAWAWKSHMSVGEIALVGVAIVLYGVLTTLLRLATTESGETKGSVRFPPDQGPGRRGLL
jgi:hypothetical protein